MANYQPCPCKQCADIRIEARLVDLEEEVQWLRALYESSRQVNLMWEQTARYAINKLGGDDVTQAITAYSHRS